MRKILPVLAFLVLAGCGTSTPATVTDTINLIDKICQFKTTDIDALIALLGAPGATVTVVANAVCAAAAKFTPKTTEAGNAPDIAVDVNGVKVKGHF